MCVAPYSGTSSARLHFGGKSLDMKGRVQSGCMQESRAC